MNSTNEKRIYIPLKNRPVNERPREKLWHHGAAELSNTELLTILVRAGSTGHSAAQVAEDLLSSCKDGLHGLGKLHPRELLRVKGIGQANGAAILASLELARRLNTIPQIENNIYLETVEDVAAYFRRQYGTSNVENFVAFFINRRYRLLGEFVVSAGGSNAVVVDPKRVFKEALLNDAKAIILAHNHPGGDHKPSQEDHKLTDQLVEAGKIFSVPIVEHVIVTEDGSFGLISNSNNG